MSHKNKEQLLDNNLQETPNKALEDSPKIDEVKEETREYLRSLMEEGHFEIDQRFHIRNAIRCNYFFGDQEMVERECKKLIQTFPEEKMRDTDVIVSTYPNSNMMGYTILRDIKKKYPRDTQQQRHIFIRDESGFKQIGKRLLQPNDRVLIVCDHILTGEFINQLVDYILKKDAQIQGIGALIDRRQKKEKIRDIEVNSVYDLTSEQGNYHITPKNPCPLCKEKVPLIESLRVI